MLIILLNPSKFDTRVIFDNYDHGPALDTMYEADYEYYLPFSTFSSFLFLSSFSLTLGTGKFSSFLALTAMLGASDPVQRPRLLPEIFNSPSLLAHHP